MILKRWQDTTLGWLLGLAAILLPVLLLPTAYDPFRFPKILFLRLVGITVLAILITAVMELAPAARRRMGSIELASLLIVGWAMVSGLVRGTVDSWYAVTNLIAALALMIGARAWASTRRRVRIMLLLMLLPGAFNAFVLLLQAFDVWHPLVSLEEFRKLPSGDREILMRAALLGNRDDVGVYLAIPATIGACLAWGLRGWKQVACVAAAGLCVLAIAVSTTMTALLMLLVAVWFLAAVRLTAARLRLGLRIVTLVLVPLVAGVAILALPPVKHRLGEARGHLGDSGLDRALGGRIGAWAATMALIEKHPALGVGPGRYPAEFMSVAAPLKIGNPDRYARDIDQTYDMVHNDYLEIAVEIGLPGLALSLWLAGLIIARFVRRLAENPDDASAGVGLTLAAIAATAAVVQFPFQIAAVYGTLAIASGVALRGPEQELQAREEESR